jgi:hypothetical protein
MAAEEGWVSKQSRWLKVWRRRYACLYDTYLYISKTRDAKPHHVIDIFALANVKAADEITGKKYSFQVTLTDGEVFSFFANSETDRLSWIQKIENIKKNPPRRVTGDDLKDKSFVVSSDDDEFYMITKDASGKETDRSRVDVVSLNVYQRQFLRKRENRGVPFDITEREKGKDGYSTVCLHFSDGTTLTVCSDGVLGSTDPKKRTTIRTPSFIETD